MSSQFGKAYKLNRFAVDTYYELGGRVLDARISGGGEAYREEGTETRAMPLIKSVGVVPKISWTQNVKRIDDYITVYGIITAEGAVPANILRYTDGVDDKELTGVKADKCRVSCKAGENIKAAIEAIAKTCADQEIGTTLHRTEEPMNYTDVSSVSVGGAIANWREWSFGVDNGVLAEHLGVTLLPAEVEETRALYSGHVLLSRKAASKLTTALAGTSSTDVIVVLVDNQTSPVTKTFTFADTLLKRSTIEIPGARLQLERVEWEGNGLVIE